MSLSVKRTPGGAGVARGGGAGWAAGVTLGVGAGLLFFYLVVYPLFGLHVTIGSDAPVYVWWARLGGAFGMGPLGSGARPGSVGLVAALARVTPAPAAGVVAGLLPALAVAAGMAGGALADVALGPDRRRFCLVAAFTGAFLSLLADGYLSTLAFLAALVAGLACMAAAVPGNLPDERGSDEAGAGRLLEPTTGAAAFVLAAGLAHPLLLALAAGVVGAGLLALLTAAMRAGRGGGGLTGSGYGPARIAAATLAGAALTPIGLLLSGGFGGAAVDTSRDAFVRRAGLGSQLRSSYVHKLLHDVPWYRALTVLGLAATPLVASDARTGGSSPANAERRRFFFGTVAGWVAIAAGGVIALLAGTAIPGQRLATSCLALPVLAGVGLAAMSRRRPARWRIAAALGTVLFVALAWSRWLGERPLAPPAVLTDARQVAYELAAAPEGTPLVVVMDDRSATPTLRVIRFENYVRDAVSPGDVASVHVFLGSPEDYSAGRPTLTGQVEHDDFARRSAALVRALHPRPLAVVVRAFDPAAFTRALAMAGSLHRDADVVVLPGSPALAPSSDERIDAVGPGPQSPWLPVWEGALVFVIAWLAGAPIAAAFLPGEPLRARWALAPSFGFAALMVASVLVDGAGLHLSGAGGWIALALAAAPGWAIALVRRGTPRPRASAPAAAP